MKPEQAEQLLEIAKDAAAILKKHKAGTPLNKTELRLVADLTGGKDAATVEALADAFEITDRRVQQLVEQGVIPRQGKGSYNWTTAVRGYIRSIHDSYAKTDVKATLDAEKIREFKNKNDRREWDFEKEKGEYVPMFLVEHFFDSVIPLWSGQIESIRVRIKSFIKQNPEPGKLSDYVDTSIDEILQEIGGTNPADFLDPKKAQDDSAKAATPMQPVVGQVPETQPGSE